MPETRNDIINEALELIGAKVIGQAANPEDLLTADTTLRQMIKRWQTPGAHLFSQNEAVLFLQPGQVKYQLGNSSSDHATETYSETTTNAAALTGAATISMTDSTGLAVSDKLGIRLDAGAIHWATVSSLGPLVFAPVLLSDVASGNAVFYYTTDMEKALRVPGARRRQGAGTTATETSLTVYGKEDYDSLPNKLSSGAPTVFYYDPKQLHGDLFIWSAPTSTTDFIKFTYYKPLAAYASASDQGDFPDEWGQALSYNLAVFAKPKFPGFVLDPIIGPMAMQLYNDLLDWDQEDASVKFEPGRR